MVTRLRAVRCRFADMRCAAANGLAEPAPISAGPVV